MQVIEEKVVGQETVKGINLYVTRLTWDTGDRSFDVFTCFDKTCLTMDESFDAYPTAAQLEALIDSEG